MTLCFLGRKFTKFINDTVNLIINVDDIYIYTKKYKNISINGNMEIVPWKVTTHIYGNLFYLQGSAITDSACSNIL